MRYPNCLVILFIAVSCCAQEQHNINQLINILGQIKPNSGLVTPIQKKQPPAAPAQPAQPTLPPKPVASVDLSKPTEEFDRLLKRLNSYAKKAVDAKYNFFDSNNLDKFSVHLANGQKIYNDIEYIAESLDKLAQADQQNKAYSAFHEIAKRLQDGQKIWVTIMGEHKNKSILPVRAEAANYGLSLGNRLQGVANSNYFFIKQIVPTISVNPDQQLIAQAMLKTLDKLYNMNLGNLEVLKRIQHRLSIR